MLIHVLILSVLAAQCEGNLSQFYQMISRLGEVEPTSLLNYGCFCGWGNSGRKKVIDCLDKCCYHHDNCYAQLSAQCRGTSYLFTSYSVDRETMACDPDQDRCKLMLCKCDHDFGVCVGHNKEREKPECKNVKDTDVCRPGENYTMPECNTSETIPEDLYHDASQCRELQSPPSGENKETTPSPGSNNTQTTEQPHSRNVQTTQTSHKKTTKLSEIKPPESQKLLNNESSQMNLSKLNELLAASLVIVLLAPVVLA